MFTCIIVRLDRAQLFVYKCKLIISRTSIFQLYCRTMSFFFSAVIKLFFFYPLMNRLKQWKNISSFNKACGVFFHSSQKKKVLMEKQDKLINPSFNPVPMDEKVDSLFFFFLCFCCYMHSTFVFEDVKSLR